MHHMAHAVKPILGMMPPDPTSLSPRSSSPGELGGHMRSLGEQQVLRAAQAHDNELGGLPRRMVRDRRPQGDQIRQRHHRHVPGPAFPRLGLRPAASLHGGDRRGVSRVGIPEGRHRRRERGDRRRRAAVRRRGQARCSSRQCHREGRAGHRRGAREWRRVLTPTSWCRASIPSAPFSSWSRSGSLPEDFVTGIRRFKMRGSSGKVNLALSELPRFTCMEPANIARWGGVPVPAERYLRGAVSISPSVDYVESAYDDAKHGSFSRRPYMDVVIPSMIDPWMAPPGQARHVDLLPVRAIQRSRVAGIDAKREAFGDAVIDALAVYAPNIRQCHHRSSGADTGRHRADHRVHRRKHLSG